jgi:hypothetical protein
MSSNNKANTRKGGKAIVSNDDKEDHAGAVLADQDDDHKTYANVDEIGDEEIVSVIDSKTPVACKERGMTPGYGLKEAHDGKKRKSVGDLTSSDASSASSSSDAVSAPRRVIPEHMQNGLAKSPNNSNKRFKQNSKNEIRIMKGVHQGNPYAILTMNMMATYPFCSGREDINGISNPMASRYFQTGGIGRKLLETGNGPVPAKFDQGGGLLMVCTTTKEMDDFDEYVAILEEHVVGQVNPNTGAPMTLLIEEVELTFEY